ncbi:hypothetical protein [Crenothrix polyspora]|uniref:Cytochrome c domain-containing protein n=1 Tax=Crenothrix polyspora TaxID=360316 RepID=A0A1R4HF50_9GAMM|nr:hypothetical protein [Crenothrix polyspora]SJM94854.1 conserved exported hypothetical protein [Crenothrix polyspora]
MKPLGQTKLLGIFISFFLLQHSSSSLAAVCGLPNESGPVSPISGDPNQPNLPNLKHYKNAAGILATYSPAGALDVSENNDFFNALGTNERTCGNCHTPQASWTITPALAQAQFQRTQGTDPLFRPNDGSVSPLADVSTQNARCEAYKMLLKYANIRVGIKMPSTANFSLTNNNISDPYSYASLANGLSLFRRPMPTTNLSFIKGVMWDGRESVISNTAGFIQFTSLGNQANDATQGHAEGPVITAAQKSSIVNFETSLYTAQLKDQGAGNLDQNLGLGGPTNLANPVIATSTPSPVAPVGFTLYEGWSQLPNNGNVNATRQAIARGEQVFNNGNLGMRATTPALPRRCTTCHTHENVGTYLVQTANAPDSETFFNVRISEPSFISKINPGLVAELPKYTFEFNVIAGKAIPASSVDTVSGAACTTASVRCKITTTDPGRALITKTYSDINKFRVPALRGLASRPPYFHNGAAKTLDNVVQHYINIFGMQVINSPTHSTDPNVITRQEVSDLVAFLNAL